MSSETFQMIITMLGGLALFIFGMNSMSDGFQKTAGDKMKKILSMLTSNPVLGVLSGALCTAVLQSSSATTVMAIGFVSAGLITFRQAIGVVMGANIGTTITAQLIAFKLGDYAWVFVFVGFLLYFFVKKREKVKDIGQVLFSFGLLFVGLNIMGDAMKPLASSDVFVHLMMNVQDTPLLGVLLGTLMTVVVQSSSATIAVLQNLASTAGPDGVSSIIGLAGAIPILFGDNIGTTITAVLASIGGTVNAKRAAAAHVIFNISGTLLYINFIPLIVRIVTYISPKGPEVEVISRQIANTHLLFNLTTTLIWLPLIGVLAAIATKIIPGKDEEILDAVPKYLDNKLVDRPMFAIPLAMREIIRLGKIALEMTTLSKKAFTEGDYEAMQKCAEHEDVINELEETTVNYLAAILAAEGVNDRQLSTVSQLIQVAGDIENIGDQCIDITDLAAEKKKNKSVFSDRANAELDICFDQGIRMVEYAVRALESGDEGVVEEILWQEEQLDQNEERLRKQHMQRVIDKTCSPDFTMLYTDTIYQIGKIGDFCKNIALEVRDIPGEVFLGTREEPDKGPDKGHAGGRGPDLGYES